MLLSPTEQVVIAEVVTITNFTENIDKIVHVCVLLYILICTVHKVS